MINIVQMDPNNKGDKTPQERKAARVVALHRIVPNLITLTAMAAGLTSIQYAINNQWEKAVLAVLMALVLDAMDGATARLMKATSEFGAQLDNLSDFLSFGVAPTIILYTWLLEESGRVGWVAMIFYTLATALRLARFFVEQKKRAKWQEGFFSGIPSPAGAGLALMPLILWLQYPEFFKQFAFGSPLIGIWTITCAGLMVSRIPTFSIKKIRIPVRNAMTVMAGVALLLAAMVNAPWQTLTVIGLSYMASIPLAILHYNKLKKLHANDVEEDPHDDLPL